MVFKVLCFTLVACTLVQALPHGKRPDLFNFAHRAGDAARETIAENSESFHEKKGAILDFAKTGDDAAVDVAKSGVGILTTLPRGVLKMKKKNGSNNGNDAEARNLVNVQNTVHETIDENATSRKNAVDSLIDVGKQAAAAVGQSLATGWNIGTSPFRFFSRFFMKKEDSDKE